MRLRRLVLVAITLGACAGTELRADPSPSCSYRQERATVGDAGTTFVGTISDVVLGQRHGCAVFDRGDVRCWGGNDLHQLSGRYDPAPGEGLTYDDWRGSADLAAGGAHTCAFNRSGVFCWGNNAAGQVDGTAEPVSGIVEVMADHGEPLSAAAGLLHTCAADASRVVCWGHNGFGQLGRSTSSACCNEPASISTSWGSGRTLALVAGAYHTCALVGEEDSGSVLCWGDDRFGALGEGEPGEMRTEAEPVSLEGGASAIAAGPHHTCALLTDGRVFCWGRDESGELGDGLRRSSATPVLVELPFAPVSLVAGGSVALSADAAGELHAGTGVGRTCAVSEDGQAMCWGDNAAGQLGDGTTIDRFVPTPVAGDVFFLSVVPGGDATCGLSDTDTLLCWGDGASGQIGSAGGSSAVPAATTVFDL